MIDYYSPDYFRTINETYDRKTDRVAWLKLQISLADKSLLYNQALLADYYNQLAKRGVNIDGINGITVQPDKGYAIASAVGGAVAMVPVGWTQAVGAVIILGSTLFSKLDVKAKDQWARNLIEVAQTRIKQSQQIAEYRKAYVQELKIRQVIPWILAVIFFLLIK